MPAKALLIDTTRCVGCELCYEAFNGASVNARHRLRMRTMCTIFYPRKCSGLVVGRCCVAVPRLFAG